MDADRFDTLAKVMARGATRRRLMRGVLGSTLISGAVALTGRDPVHAAPRCREAGNPCEGNQYCCPGLVCGAGYPERCMAPPAAG
jgi:hypothetical protein